MSIHFRSSQTTPDDRGKAPRTTMPRAPRPDDMFRLEHDGAGANRIDAPDAMPQADGHP